MKKLKLILVLLPVLFVLSCSKKNDPQPSNSTTNNNTNNNNNNNTNNTCSLYNNGSVNSYFPTTCGSYWTYAGALSYTSTVYGDTVVGGIHYCNIRNSTSATKRDFVRIDGTDYSSGSFTPSLISNQLFLKDAPQGTTWDDNYPNLIYGYDYRYARTIESVGGTKVVNGVTFSNVIEVKLEIYIDMNDGWGEDLYETDYYYYSKGVGFIQCDLESGTTYLASYQIK
jgi:hypothetical protein